MKNRLFSFFILCVLCCSAQNKTDSLKLVVKGQRQDTSTISALIILTKDLLNAGDYENGLQYATQAKTLSRKLGNKKGLGAAFHNMGLYYYNTGNYPQAMINNDSALHIRLEIKDDRGLASSYNNIGLIYFEEGNYVEALKNYFSCLKLREKLGNKKGVGQIRNNIGNVYFLQNNNKEALLHYKEALRLRKEAGDENGMADSYICLGNTYGNENKYEEALKNYALGADICKKKGAKKGLATIYTSTGVIFEKQNNFEAALGNYRAGLKINEEIGERRATGLSLGNVGNVLFNLKRYKESEDYNLRCLTISGGIGDLVTTKLAYQCLSEIYSITGRHDEALKNYKHFILLRDSLVNEENTKKQVRMEMNYSFDKKEAATKLLEEKREAVAAAESKKQRMIIISVLCVLILVTGFAVFAYRSYLQKQKANIAIVKQKEIIEEKQKEILDSIHYAKRIQTALLPNEKSITKQLNKLRPKQV